MSQAPIPFAPQQASGNEKLGGAMPLALNVFVDQAGVIRKRPGIRAYSDAPSSPSSIDPNGIVGIHKCLDGTVYAVGASGSERKIYRVAGGSANALGGGVSPSGLRGTGRPVFAETEALLVIAGGADIEKIELATGTASRLGGGAPFSTHVIAQSLRLLANDVTIDRTKVRYSSTSIGTTDYSGHEQWTIATGNTAGFFTAEARPDPVVALAENTNSVLCFGASTLEQWVSDPTYRFTRTIALDQGCGAPYSIAKREQEFYWIDAFKRVIRGADGSVDFISQGIQQTLDGITVSDAFAYRVYCGALDCVVFTFPSDGRTFVYQDKVGWSQWAGWNGSALTQFPVTCQDSFTLVGLNDGSIGELSLDAFTDMGDDIRCVIESGFVSRETDAVKDCSRVQLSLKRGTGSGTARVTLKWRDRPGPWDPPITIDLGSNGDTEPVVDLPSLGTYRRRQWSLEFTGEDELGLVSATEYFEVTEP